jgi:gliding motility-associated-like protein
MKRTLLVICLIFTAFFCHANHLKGGFFTYRYLGVGVEDPAKLRYQVTLTVYMDCSAQGQQVNNPINFTFYNAGTNQVMRNISVPISNDYLLRKNADEECITGDQRVCYYRIIVYDLPTVELDPLPAGYTVSYQRCCRIGGIDNIMSSNTIGNTYSINIPGTSAPQNAHQNNSASFLINDTAVVCGGSYFEIPFLAFDPDGDRLTYQFCDAWIGGSQGNPAPAQANPPPYETVPYSGGFSGSFPFGGQVNINPTTGLISGIAPSVSNTGEYVITVCVTEYKNGIAVATTRKELHIKVGNCIPLQASLNPEYVSCDGFTLTFSNNSPSSEIKSYFWNFGDGNTSTASNPTHTYVDTGTYTLKLVVNRGEQCTDSTTAPVKVYPGFFPGFSVSGICVNKPTQFNDTTKTRYGVVDSWSWNFGDANSTSDTSRLQNPKYTYSQTGPKSVTFIVTNSKGCVDTLIQTVDIIDKPPLRVTPKDTLICSGDTVPLQAIGNGLFTWTPAGNITNANTANPTVSPTSTTIYSVELNDNGCINRDSLRVRVVNFVTLQTRGDTTICFGDSALLNASTDGLRYNWTPANEVTAPNNLITTAIPTKVGANTYRITSFLGGCTPATDDVVVTTIPFPMVQITAADDTICYESSTQLTATTNGTNFTWSPITGLTNSNTLTPLAAPLRTTQYILTVTDPSSGCPKPSRDTVLINVLPPINPFAGRDTAVVVSQPLQFNGSGGVKYLWSPPYELSDITIPNPVATYTGERDSVTYTLLVYNEKGCVDSAFVTVRIFKTNPQIFVPTGFTPNGDGRNDAIRPIAAGIAKIEYFRIFNRWGQVVFNTTISGQGWDGRIKGKEQATNVYVWIVKAVDFTGKSIFAKGTVTLIR